MNEQGGKISNDDLKRNVAIIANLLRTIQIKRALEKAEPSPALNFWRVICGNLMDAAILDWCKLFGSDDKTNQVCHWKNAFQDHDEFRAGILKATGLDQAGWQAYWEQIKGLRDTVVAHHDLKRAVEHKTWPVFDAALRSAGYYYERILGELKCRNVTHLYPDNLAEYGDRFLDQATDIAKAAITATAGISETVR